MKEQKLDDLERMFRNGLKNFEEEPDAAVWVAIQDAMKKRRRFWLFWSVAGIVAIGLVATVLLQNQSMDHEPLTIEERRAEPAAGAESEVGDEETGGLGDEGNAIVRHTERSRSTTDLADDMVMRGSEDEEMRGLGDGEPVLSLPKGSTTDEPKQNTNPILSIPIFLKQGLIPPYTALTVSPYKPKNKSDTATKYSPWSIAFNPSVIVPSIHSFGKQGTVNYEKTNKTKTGVSFALNLNYSWKSNWILRTGFDWSSYTVSGNHRYKGLTDTVEWIDRERNTGFQVMPNDRSWSFESQYNWIGIPIEIGRSQNFGAGFSWEWTLGAGINYLYRSGKLSENNPYLSGIDEGLKPLQVSLSAGFGVYYQLKGPWSTFVNMRYRYQPNNLYQSELLREKHQVLRFGFGLQYQFIKRKGN